ncbi:De-etiolated protein 1, Det1 [Dillenia turbinata]|uniref:De-etiolated protein 1, Det1 n=1 Tax=Dillenia turbinata TaxID=194707 RepID=A0AAN8UTH9_9MAGN
MDPCPAMLISAIDRHRQSTDHPIKFSLRRPPSQLRFKIKPDCDISSLYYLANEYPLTCGRASGPEAGSMDGRTKRISSFLFHPNLPLALSVQQTLFLHPSVVNIHFRR